MPSILTTEQRAGFERDGYVLARGLFDAEEARLLREAMEKDPAIAAHFYDRHDATGAATKMVTWNHPGDSVYGMAARCARMVDTMEDLLGGEVYHYHSKLTAKEPYEGGAWEWHQDYGYWYNNGCLFPLMASCMVALDRTTRANGCLQVMRGSHLMGRIDHACSRASRSAPTSPASRRRSCGWRPCMRRWSPATGSSSIATRCTARTRTARPTGAGR